MAELLIDGRLISDAAPCYVIAEVGHNHGGSVDTARKLIQTFAAVGVDAIKLQKRHNQTLYSPAMLASPYEHEHSYGPTYGAHRAALEFGLPEYIACRATAKAAKVSFFATAFDEPSADFLMEVGVPAIKLASAALTDTRLLRHCASLGVPLILSTGGGDAQDIDRAVTTIGHQQLALLHCTAAYPVTDAAELNLRCLATLRQRYPELVIGWSAHVTGPALGLVAYALGARILEYHVTLNRASKGTDHAFSLEPGGMRWLCDELSRAQLALGDGVKKFYPSEVGPLSKMRRWFVNGRWQIGTKAEQACPTRA